MRNRTSKKERRFQSEVEESCAMIRSKIGDDDTLPKEISFTDGKVVGIDTNVYQLSLSKGSSINQYDVQLEPEVLSSKVITHFLYTALCPNGGPMSMNEKWQKIIFDGQRIIYSSLDDLQGEFEIQARKDDPEKKVKVIVKHIRTINKDDTESLLSIYNTAFHKAYHALNLSNFRRKWINENDVNNAGSFKIFNGFLPSVSYLSHGLSYVLNTATRIDRQGTLYEYIKNSNALNDPSKRAGLESGLRSLQIQTAHRPKKPKTVIISNILWDKTASSYTFERINPKTKEKSIISVAQYYKEVYNHDCKPDDILIEMVTRANGQDKVTIFPSSVLKTFGITDHERGQRDVMKDLSRFTKISTQTRKEKLDAFINSLKTQSEAKSFLDQWGFELGDSIKINGHVIEPPVLEISKKNGGANDEYKLNDKLGFQNIWKEFGMYQGATIKNALLIVAPRNSNREVQTFIEKLQQYGPQVGLKLPQINPNEHVLYIENTNPNNYCQVIAQYFNSTPQENLPNFVVCFIPGTDKKRYNGIKHFLTVELGVLSQCIQTSRINQGNQKGGGILSIITNIAIQIASKLGGVPAKVKVPLKSTMVIGLSLPSSSLRGTSPVCAGTCSTDYGLVHFYSNVKSLQRGENVIPEDFLTDFVKEGLRRFSENAEEKEYPKNIIVYRDGVTYAQMPKLRQIEVNAIVNAVQEVTGNKDTSIVYMIAQKHASIRIMKIAGPNVENAGAGTVITDDISAKGIAEFYMISHFANQGAASPTRYTILYQYPKSFEDNQLIELTHYQTLQYPNWSGSIRTPACLMLASKLADMSKSHLSSDAPKEFLNNKLHFL